ncbi:MAG: heparinase II/III family protein [Capsulimonadaceae bacterium]|nr:heparinase II/III family protein [Capsulimonadaceae bacterium]
MTNLLTSGITEADIREILLRRSRTPLFPPAGSPVWRAAIQNPVLASVFASVRDAALREADEPLPPLTDELYAEITRSGNRTRFERPYFERRRRLGRAAASLLTGPDEDGRLKRSMIDKLSTIRDEESWSLPAHVRTSSGKEPNRIDLFAGETANQVAEILTVFGAILPDDLQASLRERLSRTVFRSFIDEHDECGWSTNTANWNAVCHQGVAGSALQVEEDIDVLAKILALTAQGLPRFLLGFGIDGGTSEGPGYWGYGFGWFARLNEQLEWATGGELSLFDGDPRIPEIARFGIRMTLSADHFVNFSDGGATGRLDPTLLAYLGKRLGIDELSRHAAKGYRDLATTGVEHSLLRADFAYYTRLIAGWPIDINAPEPDLQPQFYFRDLDALIARRTDPQGRLWELAAKGGHNAEAHNHNDCGSYLVLVDGQPFVSEIGAPEYTRQFFTASQRYESIAARSLGHSVPLVGGIEQPEGARYASKVIEHTLADDVVRFVVDLTACYPEAAGCAKLIRTIEYRSEGRLTVRDEYALTAAAEGKIETAIITHAPVERIDATAAIVAAGRRMRVTPDEGSVIRSVDIHEYNDHLAQPARIFRIVIAPSPVQAAGTIGYSLTLD